MAKVVSFGTYWQSYGRQSIVLPDSIDAGDPDAVREYILMKWDDIPLPSGDYVMDSAELDVESIEIEGGR